MSYIGTYGKDHSADSADRDDILDQGEGQSFHDARDDERFAGFDNRGPQDGNADQRTDGWAQQWQTGDAAQQAALTARAGDFQRRLHAIQQDTTGANAADHEASEQSPHTEMPASSLASGFLGQNPHRFGHQPPPPGLSQLFAHEDSRNTQPEADTEQLLATSIAMSSTLPMFTTLQQVEAVQPPADIARVKELVSAIEGRVAQAIQTEQTASASGNTTISINMAGLVEGLHAITIRLSATSLDVVLSSAVELVSEAQSLADRLSKRF